jgi:hypothetical protein
VAVVAATGADVDLVTVLLPTGTPDGTSHGTSDGTDATVTADCAGDTVTVRVERPGRGVDTVRWTAADKPDWERAC